MKYAELQALRVTESHYNMQYLQSRCEMVVLAVAKPRVGTVECNIFGPIMHR